MTLFIISVGVALGVSFLCSLCEATLLSLTPSQVGQLSQRNPAIAAVWSRFKANIEKPIAVILVLNTAAHTIGASVAGAEFEKLFGDRWIVVFSLVFTYLMLQFTEILPKTLGVRYNREFAVVIAQPLTVLIKVLAPVIHLIHFVNRPFERQSKRKTRAPATLEELTSLAGLARLSNLISPQEERIISRATRLDETLIRQVMIDAQHISFLTTAMSLPQAIIAAHLDPHTRFPVCEENDRDRVVGYVNFKEMIYRTRTNPGDPTLKGIIRPVHFASPEESAADLLRVFTTQHFHMAIVRDTNGRTLGLVTLEDIVEELVGEIEDEFDRLPAHCQSLKGNVWMVGGGLPVSEIKPRTGIDLPQADQGSLSAWILRRLKKPQLNEVFHEGDVEVMVRRLRRGNVFEAQLRLLAPGDVRRTSEHQ